MLHLAGCGAQQPSRFQWMGCQYGGLKALGPGAQQGLQLSVVRYCIDSVCINNEVGSGRQYPCQRATYGVPAAAATHHRHGLEVQRIDGSEHQLGLARINAQRSAIEQAHKDPACARVQGA